MGSLFKNIVLLPGRLVITLARALGLVPPAPRFYVRRPRTSPLAVFVSAFFWGGLALVIVAINLKTVPPAPAQPGTPPRTQADHSPPNLLTPPPDGGETPGSETTPSAEAQQAEVWLVILHSIPKRAQSEDDRRAARAEADRRAAGYKRQGLDAQIFDTDSFPRLKGGFWAVALGPFETGATARQIGDLLREQSPGLMVRQAM